MNSYLIPIFGLSLIIVGFTTYTLLDTDSEIQTQSGIIGTGHYTVTVTDSFGVVTAYRQSPNAVLNGGENCVAKMIFGSNGGDQVGVNVCIGQISEGWRYMALDEDPQILLTDKDLRDPADSAGLSGLVFADITWNQNSTGLTTALSKVTVRLANTFTNSGADETIFAVGLFNSSTGATNSMLSKANFTGVLVTGGSDLTVNYDFEIGGGTVP